jgi:hypothetical protein
MYGWMDGWMYIYNNIYIIYMNEFYIYANIYIIHMNASFLLSTTSSGAGHSREERKSREREREIHPHILKETLVLYGALQISLEE